MNFFIVKQLPVLPPETYLEDAVSDLKYVELVVPRVLGTDVYGTRPGRIRQRPGLSGTSLSPGMMIAATACNANLTRFSRTCTVWTVQTLSGFLMLPLQVLHSRASKATKSTNLASTGPSATSCTHTTSWPVESFPIWKTTSGLVRKEITCPTGDPPSAPSTSLPPPILDRVSITGPLPPTSAPPTLTRRPRLPPKHIMGRPPRPRTT